MMKHEFEQMVGHTLTVNEYDRVEKCYMTFDCLFPDKKAVADFYNANGMAAFSALYDEVILLGVDVRAMADLKKENDSLKTRIAFFETLFRTQFDASFVLQNQIEDLEKRNTSLCIRNRKLRKCLDELISIIEKEG